MARATLTTRGRITIPKEVRDCLHLHTGDQVEFVIQDESETILKPITKSVDDVFGKLYSPTQPQ
jgi:antitoxin PrlF